MQAVSVGMNIMNIMNIMNSSRFTHDARSQEHKEYNLVNAHLCTFQGAYFGTLKY